MKNLNRNRLLASAVVSIAFSFVSGSYVSAATTPVLGVLSTYSILSGTYTNTSVTTINGDVGFTTPPAMAPLGTHTNYGSGIPYAAAGLVQGTVLGNLNAQPCTFTFAPGAVNLSTDVTHGIASVYTPGVYCSSGAMNVGGPLVLNGTGTYIFRTSGALNTAAGAIVSTIGGSSCDIFWTPGSATTIGANTTFIGNVIDEAGITVGANTTWNGLALAFGGTVTTDTSTITAPTCVVPIPVVPIVPPVTPVVVNNSMGGIYSMPWITPSIHIEKVATPSFIASGSASVVYDYTVTNVGQIALNNVKVTDDKCFSINFLSGDVNNDLKLDMTETWKYNCTSIISQTTTNIAKATGYADYSTTTDTAYAVVNVGYPTTVPVVLGVATTTVIYPTFPDTGLPPSAKSFSWALFTGLLSLMALSVFLITYKNKELV